MAHSHDHKGEATLHDALPDEAASHGHAGQVQHDHQHDHAHHDHAHHGHAHGAHGHAHAVPANTRAFAIGTVLNLVFVVAELVYGFAANSLSLIADATHNFADVIGLMLAWGGAWLAQRAPSARRTYGFRRASILAALINAAILLVGVGGIFFEAIRRFGDPQPIETGTVMWVATLGIVINAGTALLFLRDRKSDLNVHGAFLHMAADAGVSAGVVVAAGLIAVTGLAWIDPAIGIAVSVVILLSSWSLARDSVNLALDAVPRSIDPAHIETYLKALPGVSEVHDLHIWALSTTETALTVHLVRRTAALDDRFLSDVSHELSARFGISHVAIQVESGDPDFPCQLAPAHVV